MKTWSPLTVIEDPTSLSSHILPVAQHNKFFKRILELDSYVIIDLPHVIPNQFDFVTFET